MEIPDILDYVRIFLEKRNFKSNLLKNVISIVNQKIGGNCHKLLAIGSSFRDIDQNNSKLTAKI